MYFTTSKCASYWYFVQPSFNAWWDWGINQRPLLYTESFDIFQGTTVSCGFSSAHSTVFQLGLVKETEMTMSKACGHYTILAYICTQVGRSDHNPVATSGSQVFI